MGSTYKLKEIHTVGDLKKRPPEIIDDLPEGEFLEVNEFELHKDELFYELKEWIVQ